jgi:hypothetical protein
MRAVSILTVCVAALKRKNHRPVSARGGCPGSCGRGRARLRRMPGIVWPWGPGGGGGGPGGPAHTPANPRGTLADSLGHGHTAGFIRALPIRHRPRQPSRTRPPPAFARSRARRAARGRSGPRSARGRRRRRRRGGTGERRWPVFGCHGLGPCLRRCVVSDAKPWGGAAINARSFGARAATPHHRAVRRIHEPGHLARARSSSRRWRPPLTDGSGMCSAEGPPRSGEDTGQARGTRRRAIAVRPCHPAGRRRGWPRRRADRRPPRASGRPRQEANLRPHRSTGRRRPVAPKYAYQCHAPQPVWRPAAHPL